MNIDLLKNADLTDGEAKVYLSLLEIGESTTGIIIKKSKVARSFVYNILDKLVEKGLVSYASRGGKTLYSAADPERILDYLEKKKQQLDENKEEIKKSLSALKAIQESKPRTNIQIYEGFRGLQTAFEKYKEKTSRGEEILALGVPAFQEDKYHEYWKETHEERVKLGIKNRMLFNKDTPKSVLANRNSYKGCVSKYMDTDIKTPAWIFIYGDVSVIFLQDNKGPLVVEITNSQIAQTFKAYFEDYWKRH
jgi:HTH-type transcriptional regulator, sugar sensing transcriptional regulator